MAFPGLPLPTEETCLHPRRAEAVQGPLIIRYPKFWRCCMNLVSALLTANAAAHAVSTQAAQAAQFAAHAVVLMAVLAVAFVLFLAGGILAAR